MATNELKTVILRFRDLVVDTVYEHKRIIENNSFVWWGWWSKPQEVVPINEIKKLRAYTQNDGGLLVYLVNSGSESLYTAKCTDMFFQNDDPVHSPDPKKTPSYYSASEYKLWFKFEEISEAISEKEANKTLRHFSYYRVDNLFASGHSPFGPFYNKRIYSINELIAQQRTIWFIRDFKPGDKTHEIHSYSASLSNGTNVDNTFRLLPTNELLWISDIHFSEDHHAFKVSPGNDNRLSYRLQQELARIPLTVSHVIISGDFTFRAQEKEFNMAERFINDLNSFYNLDETCYSICPGNHDLMLSSSEYNEKDTVDIASDKAKDSYVEFYRKTLKIEPTDKLYSIRRLLTPNLIPVEIISVNSCLLQQGVHFMGMGFVGNDQLNEIGKELLSTKEKPVLRILVMHHHLLPVMYSEEPAINHMYSMMLDSESISQFIVDNNIRVVLHGHTHKDYYAEIVRINKQKKNEDNVENCKHKYYIVGTGSVGAITSDLSDSRPNMFSTLSFVDKKLIVDQYSLSPNGEVSQKLNSFTIPI